MLGIRAATGAALTGAPTLSTSSGPGQVVVSWTHPGTARYPMYLYRNGALIASKAPTDTQHTDSVAAGTYLYYIAYVKNGVTMPVSVAVNGTANAVIGTPTLNSVTSNASGFSITVGWSNAGAFTTRVYSRSGSPGSYSYLLLTTAGVGVTSATISTSSATSYTIVVRHFDGTNESGDSNDITVTTNLGAPTTLTFSSISTSGYTLGWSNTDATSPVDVLRGGSSLGVQAAGTSSYLDATLAANTQYSWVVRYTKNGVTGANLAGSQFTRPNAPTGLSVALEGFYPKLTWTNSHSLPTYIYRGGVYIGLQSTGTIFVDYAADGATTYNYTVRHLNSTSSLESADSNTASVTTPLPAPSGFAATASSASVVSTSWTNGATGVTTFVERSTDGVNFSVANGAGTTGTSFADTGRIEATNYWYRARHLKNSVYSAYTSVVQVTTPLSSTVQSFSFSSRTATSISMSWGTPPSGYNVQVYQAANATSVNDTNTYLGESAGTSRTAISLSPATTYTFGARYRLNALYGPFATFVNATNPSSLVSLTASTVNSTAINLSIQKVAAEETDVVVERSADGVNWAALYTVGHADFNGSPLWTQDNTGLTASTTYYYRARARYTSLNAGAQTFSAYASANATTSASQASITFSPLSVDSILDRVVASWSTSNAPAGGYLELSYSWTRTDVNNTQVDSNSGGDPSPVSPYSIYFSIDILDTPVPNGDTVNLLVELRLFNSSAQQVAYASRTASFDAPALFGLE